MKKNDIIKNNTISKIDPSSLIDNKFYLHKYVDGKKYSKIHPKYQKLIYYKKWKDIFNNYINEFFNNTKYNHDWINYLVYYEVNNNIHIYFRNFFIKELDKNTSITLEIVKSIFMDTINVIKNKKVLLPIDYLRDILQYDINFHEHKLLIKKDKSCRIQIKFQIIENTIKFFVKYNEFFTCDISNIHNFLDDIYNNYKLLEKKKKKIIFLNFDDNEFDCEDSILDIQKSMFNNGYWLDIAFHFNKNNFQNNCYLQNINLYFVKYDIIVFLHMSGPSPIVEISFEKISNKLIIIIPIKFFNDYLFLWRGDFGHKLISKIQKNNNIMCIGKRDSSSIKNTIKFYNYYNFFNKLQFTPIRRNLNYIENLNNNKIKNFSIVTKYMPVLKYNIIDKNQYILSKKDFYKVYNLDLNKKLLIIFTRWPKINKPSQIDHILNFVKSLLLKESQTIELIINILKNKYNILFKLHPEFLKKTNKDIYINKETKKLIYSDKYKDINYFMKYNIVDIDFEMEILKYADIGLIFNHSSVSNKFNVYDIPVIEISSRELDWYKIVDDKLKLDTSMIEYLNNNYPEFTNIFNVDDNSKYVYGCRVYWEDIKDNLKDNLYKIFSKNYKSEFKYFIDHPFTGNEYFSTQICSEKKILELINEKGYNTICNKLNYLFLQETITVYKKSHIDVSIENEICTIEILKDQYINEKFVSSGVHFYIYNIEPYCTLNMKFNVKLDTNEKNVYLRLYTGIKWITYTDASLTTDFQEMNLNEYFNLENNSKWRLSTTSNKVGQKIIIENFIINNV